MAAAVFTNGGVSAGRRWLHGCLVVAGAAMLTLAHFLVLPLMQSIRKPPVADTLLQTVDTADLPPPAAPEPEPEEEPKPEEAEPELAEASQPLDLAQLEIALDPGGAGGSGWLAGGLGVALGAVVAKAGAVEELFSLADLDQKPRILYEPSPMLDASLRKRTPATVHVLFVVDETGKVESPSVLSSTDPSFDRPTLAAVKQWKFEPGKRQGKPVRFRMRRPITFPKS